MFRFASGSFSRFQLAGYFTIEVTLLCGIGTNLTVRLFVSLLPCGFVMMLLVWVFLRSH